jgi:hypothetical protein
MSEFSGGFFLFFLAAVLVAGAFFVGADVTESRISRNCSLTGTYVIDNDTVLACRVIKRNTDEAKPSEPKEEEQSL